MRGQGKGREEHLQKRDDGYEDDDVDDNVDRCE